MCFSLKRKYVPWPFKPKMERAREDIVCYKETSDSASRENKFFSHYQNFHYDKLEETKRVRIKPIWWRVLDLYEINEGYHTFTNRPTPSTYIAVGKFIIPKGTKYYKNSQEMVSERLIYLGLEKAYGEVNYPTVEAGATA